MNSFFSHRYYSKDERNSMFELAYFEAASQHLSHYATMIHFLWLKYRIYLSIYLSMIELK